MTTRLTPIETRAEVLERIAELEIQVAQLKIERRAASIAAKKAMLAYWDASSDLKRLKEYLFRLAVHFANTDV